MRLCNSQTWIKLIELFAYALIIILAFKAMLLISYGQDLPPQPAGALIIPQTASVKLAWDPSPDAGVAGYRVHYGIASGFYTDLTNAGPSTNIVVKGLTPAETYYFTATAVGTNMLESDFSNEISYTVPPEYLGPPEKLGVAYVPQLTIIVEGADYYTASNGVAEVFYTEVARWTLILDASAPTGFFRSRIAITNVEAVQWP
jgi:hypothetical protein